MIYYVKDSKTSLFPLTPASSFHIFSGKWKSLGFFLINSNTLINVRAQIYLLPSPQAVCCFYCNMKHNLVYNNTLYKYMKNLLAHVQGAHSLNFQ